jgi:hypothetical protein
MDCAAGVVAVLGVCEEIVEVAGIPAAAVELVGV